MEKYSLVIIDDSMNNGLQEAFVRTLAKEDKEAAPIVFTNPDDGYDYVIKNLNQRMIVLLDYRFDGTTKNGFDVLKQIREKTSLLYIVLMTVNGLAQIANDNNIIDLINQDFVYFFNKNEDDGAFALLPLIASIKKQWNTRFDCLLEEWIANKQEDKTKKVIAFGNKSYSWEELLAELRQQTEVGKSFEKMVNQFYISELNRGKNNG